MDDFGKKFKNNLFIFKRL